MEWRTYCPNKPDIRRVKLLSHEAGWLCVPKRVRESTHLKCNYRSEHQRVRPCPDVFDYKPAVNSYNGQPRFRIPTLESNQQIERDDYVEKLSIYENTYVSSVGLTTCSRRVSYRRFSLISHAFARKSVVKEREVGYPEVTISRRTGRS